MQETLICNVCENPGLFEQATEVRAVRCNVRRFGEESFTVWRCSNCLSLHCREAVDLDPYYVNYPMTKQRLDFATLQAFKNRLSFMRAQGLQSTHSVLDYGCGTGLFVEFLKRNGFDAVGFDPYIPTFFDRSILERTYDFITSQDVIEHVSEPRELVQEYMRLMNKGGMLFVGTPNAGEIDLTRLEQFSMELHQPYHRHLFSEEALINLCQNAAFEFVTVNHRFYYDTLFPMVNTQFIKRYIRKAGGFLDAGFEDPKVAMVLTSPELLFFGFLGYLFRARGNMMAVFRRVG